MKLATLNDGSRDGALCVVSRDLKTAQLADRIAPTLQAALDDWSFIAPQLNELYQQLNAGRGHRSFEFDPARCMAPLPRAYQWADASAYVNHVELVRKARKAEMPESFWEDPLMYQGGSDDLLGPMDDIVLAHEEWGIDFEAEIAVVTGDVPSGATPDQALPTFLVAISSDHVTTLERELRSGTPPVIARIEEGRLMLDLRTVAVGDEEKEIAIAQMGSLTTANAATERAYESIEWAKGATDAKKKIVVPMRTLETVLGRNDVPLDFELLVVDVEGAEEPIIDGLLASRWRPRVIIVELVDRHADFADHAEIVRSHAAVRARTRAAGYTEHFSDLINTIFVRTA